MGVINSVNPLFQGSYCSFLTAVMYMPTTPRSLDMKMYYSTIFCHYNDKISDGTIFEQYFNKKNTFFSLFSTTNYTPHYQKNGALSEIKIMHYSGLKLLLKHIFGDIRSSYKVWTASSAESPVYCLSFLILARA